MGTTQEKPVLSLCITAFIAWRVESYPSFLHHFLFSYAHGDNFLHTPQKERIYLLSSKKIYTYPHFKEKDHFYSIY